MMDTAYFKNPLDDFPVEGKYNYWDIALWLRHCRAYIRREDYDSQKTYVQAVGLFCEQWTEHYTKFESIYKSQTFRKALMALVPMQHCEFLIKYYGGKIDFTDRVIVEDVKATALGREMYKTISEEVSKYIQAVKLTFIEMDKPGPFEASYKTKLHGLITDSAQNYNIIRLYFNKKLTDKQTGMLVQSYDSAVHFFETLSTKERNSYFFENPCELHIKRTLPCNQALKLFHIPKTLFFEYFGNTKNEYLFPKYMFVNMAFLLSLDEAYFVKLLESAGYALEPRLRKFDRIILNAFSMGWGQEMTAAVIEKCNAEAKAKTPKSFPIPAL